MNYLLIIWKYGGFPQVTNKILNTEVLKCKRFELKMLDFIYFAHLLYWKYNIFWFLEPSNFSFIFSINMINLILYLAERQNNVSAILLKWGSDSTIITRRETFLLYWFIDFLKIVNIFLSTQNVNNQTLTIFKSQ